MWNMLYGLTVNDARILRVFAGIKLRGKVGFWYSQVKIDDSNHFFQRSLILCFSVHPKESFRETHTHHKCIGIPTVISRMTTAARKAWNEAMRATAGSAALPPSLQQRPLKRRSDRNKKQERRAKARKVDMSSGESEEYRQAVFIDSLEGVDPAIEQQLDDEEYDELNELDGKKGRKKRGAAKAKAGTLPKRFLPRTLASILVEDAGREDGIAKEFLEAEARLPANQQLPKRKFCPVTGLEATYTEPKTGLPYSGFSALEQIRERPPPWMLLGGSAAFLESVKSIRDDIT